MSFAQEFLCTRTLCESRDDLKINVDFAVVNFLQHVIGHIYLCNGHEDVHAWNIIKRVWNWFWSMYKITNRLLFFSGSWGNGLKELHWLNVSSHVREGLCILYFLGRLMLCSTPYLYQLVEATHLLSVITRLFVLGFFWDSAAFMYFYRPWNKVSDCRLVLSSEKRTIMHVLLILYPNILSYVC